MSPDVAHLHLGNSTVANNTRFLYLTMLIKYRTMCYTPCQHNCQLLQTVDTTDLDFL